MKHKILPLLTAVILLLVLLLAMAVSAETAGVYTSGDWRYMINDGEATIYGGSMQAYIGSAVDVTVPSTLGGYPVTTIGYGAFYNRSNIKSITIGSNVTTIDTNAFAGCDGLKNITIPNNVTQIGYYAFGRCYNLESVVIGGDVISIGDEAFKNCPKLNSVIIVGNGLSDIGDRAFMDCCCLKSITLPNSTAKIGNNAFSRCSSLESITLPNGITGIGSDAFSDTEHYKTEANWDNGVLYIGCHLIGVKATKTTVTVQGGTKTIAGNAFSGCPNITSITLPSGIVSLGDYAFDGCRNLTDINLPNSITNMGSGVFRGCTSLENIVIPNCVTDIGERAFYDCTVLTDITIGNSVKDIGKWAFLGCTSLKNITIPNSVTHIGEGAFHDCYNLQNLTIPFVGESTKDNTRLKYVFSTTSLKKVTVTKHIGDYAFCDCNNITSITIGSQVTFIGQYAFCNCEGITEISIPDGITSIKKYTFHGCSNLSDITLPSSITKIDTHAFSECAHLQCVAFPNSVKSIGDQAFSECSRLKTVTIPKSVTKIGKHAFFSGCSKLRDVYYDGNIVEWDKLATELLDTATVYCAKKASISLYSAYVDLTYFDNYYTGKALKPPVTVTRKDGKKLKAGTDYTKTYTKNIKPGKATVTIKGNGYYSGTLTKTFKILPRFITSFKVSGIKDKTYTGKALTQTLKLKFGRKILKIGTDYTVTYKGNKLPGTATVIIKGKGNYTGKITRTFTIAPKAPTKISLSAKNWYITTKWAKSAGVTGYYVKIWSNALYSSSFCNYTSTNSMVFSVARGYTYYVCVQAYKKVNSSRYIYSNWSSVKKIYVK